MTQSNYENIIACIKHGAPAMANELIVALNETIQLATERIAEMKEEERRRTEAEMKRQAEEQAKKDSTQSKVTK